jgi:PPOX class probable F420-dependent enzyme
MGRNYATLVTTNPDGTPHATVTWVAAHGGMIWVNTAKGRVKDRNIRRDPRVAVLTTRPDFYDWISVNGTVVEAIEGDEALVHIDALSRRYDGEPWEPVEGQVRVIFKIRPETILRHSDD